MYLFENIAVDAVKPSSLTASTNFMLRHRGAISTLPLALNATPTFPLSKLKKSSHEKAMYQPILLITLHLELYIRAMQIGFSAPLQVAAAI